jgi:16S rRNA (adenine1518-N6/adenine1519-N6)-dimethyltransferase
MNLTNLKINMNKTQLLPKKHFGQNFLINSQLQHRVFQSVSELVKLTQKTQIVEIGPGEAHITQHLQDLKLPITALELDTDAVNFLAKTERISKDFVTVLHKDALKVLVENDPCLPDDFLLFSSLPYNVGSRILVELGLKKPHIPFVVVIQKEVAEKTKLDKNKLTFFGLWLNLFWNCKLAYDISAGNFFPRPNVTSSVLIGLPYTNSEIDLSNQDKRQNILNLLQTILEQPKKTLYNNLRAKYNKLDVDKLFANYKWDLNLRFTSKNYSEIIKAINEFNNDLQLLEIPTIQN